ncbi:Fic family protein [Actinobacillus genomosp. 1]|uniref:Fic family protein n=1 Tax=Actinobacillus genomosp. 1 TaxID=254839 RepID=UPI002442FCD4|nr:Fic family protein [Actinobacillus genomosp. 1]WGE34408.1 Fic family protein [Actinobacillus genomosp. 1]
MKMPKPPAYDELLQAPVNHNDFFSYLAEFKATDEKGRYLAWDKFKRVNPNDSLQKWLAVKMNRKTLQKTLKIGDISFAFCVPDSLQATLHFIDKSTGGSVGVSSLEGLSKQEQGRFLLKSLVMEEAITSAQLEGAVTTRKVAKEMLETARKPRTKDEMMIVNNYYLMQEAIARKDEPLSIELILELHRIATHNAIENKAVAGEFRQDDEIYIADEYGDKIHQPPTHTELNHLMTAFCDFANDEHTGESGNFIHPVIKAIILHFLIGYIHPFGDGNGRTARALFYWYMLKSGYWLFEFISVSRLLKEAPKQYAMSYIDTETDELDMTYFLYYQAHIIKRAIADLENYIINKQRDFSNFVSVIADFTAKTKISHRQIQILQKAVKETGYIFTAKEISNEYGISENTARSDLKALLDLNLLGQFKIGNAIGYISPNDLLERLKRA